MRCFPKIADDDGDDGGDESFNLGGEPEVHLWRRWPRNAGQLRDIWIERASTENLWDKVARHFYVVKFRDLKGAALAGPL